MGAMHSPAEQTWVRGVAGLSHARVWTVPLRPHAHGEVADLGYTLSVASPSHAASDEANSSKTPKVTSSPHAAQVSPEPCCLLGANRQ